MRISAEYAGSTNDKENEAVLFEIELNGSEWRKNTVENDANDKCCQK